jgi:hypothetical protein
VSLRADKELEAPHQPTLWGHHLPPCLPAGRAPGLDARGRGVWLIADAVVQRCGTLWDPFRGFPVRRAR